MVTLCRPWYAHSPELCVPLKLFSTLQEDFTPIGKDDREDDDDEGVTDTVMIRSLLFFEYFRSKRHQLQKISDGEEE